MIKKVLEDLADMLDMFFVSAIGIYEDIIQISHTEFV